MKPKQITGDQLKAGDVYRIVRYFWQQEDIAEIHRSTFVADYDKWEADTTFVEVLGKAKQIKLPGLDEEYTPWLHKGTLYVGCQKINALKAFKALGKALGYEIDG